MIRADRARVGSMRRWIVGCLSSYGLATAKPCADLFEFDSATLRGGTGEIRSWIVVAAACREGQATIVDYIPAHHAVTGLGFGYFSLPGK